MIGIYKITNPIGKIYIGQSIDIKKRFNAYKKLRCKNQPKIYNSFVKYGLENHTFEILEELDVHSLNKRERFWQKEFDVLNNGLNCKLTNENDFNGSFCKETKEKMSNSAKVKVFTKEHRLNMSINRIGSKNAMFGKKQSEETKAKIRIAKQNMSDQSRLNYSISAKKRSKEFYENLSIKNKGKLPPNSKLVLNLETGIYYDSVTDASRTLHKGQGSRTLSCKLLGKRFNNTNFIYV
jgi:group I intron endonuclease